MARKAGKKGADAAAGDVDGADRGSDGGQEALAKGGKKQKQKGKALDASEGGKKKTENKHAAEGKAVASAGGRDERSLP